MTQSGYIAGALLLGFVVYLAAKNRLGVYASVLWGGAGATASAPAANNTVFGTQLPSWLSTILNWTPEILQAAP